MKILYEYNYFINMPLCFFSHIVMYKDLLAIKDKLIDQFL